MGAAVAPVLAPVELEIVRDHPFKRKPGKKRGCATCGAGKLDPAHLGAPPSMNSGNHSMHPQAYQALKHAWQTVLTDALERTGLPTRLDRVMVEGECTFPDRGRRDQGNYRWMLEKALGDALVAGGWLEDDDWARYEFGGLAYRYEKGTSRLRLLVMPA